MKEIYEIWCGCDDYTQQTVIPAIHDYLVLRTTSQIVAYSKLYEKQMEMKKKSQEPQNATKRLFVYLIKIDLSSVLYYENEQIPRYESHVMEWYNYSQRDDIKLWRITYGVKYEH